MPTYELNAETFLLVSPQIHLDPILMVPSICLYNTDKNIQILPENTTLFSILFNTDTLLNLPQNKKQVVGNHQFDKSIINYSFLQNMVNTISKIAFMDIVQTRYMRCVFPTSPRAASINRCAAMLILSRTNQRRQLRMIPQAEPQIRP